MLIENTDALKRWLIVVLEPLCDADSSALARYVLALVKKDKPEKDLKRVMIEQLDVFLAEATKPFVERLFNAIGNEEYLTIPTIISAKENNDAENLDDIIVPPSTSFGENVIRTDNSNIIEDKLSTTTCNSASSAQVDTTQTPPLLDDHKTKEIHNSINSNEAASAIELFPSATIAGNNNSTTSYPQHAFNMPIENSSTSAHHVRSASPPTRAIADKENQPRENRRRRASLRSRSPSRSRSNERLSRRSRSRDRRANEREKNQRQFRNKSPPNLERHHTGGSGGGRRNFERRRAGGGVIVDERSPRFSGSSGVKNRLNRSNSPRSRSPTPDRLRSGQVRGTVGSPDHHHQQQQQHHHHQLQQQQQHDVSIGMSEKRQRCRDFDEKGYCVRGETCPWDHGINPVVFEGMSNTALISMSMREYNPDAPDLWTRSGPTTCGPAPPPASGINPFTGNARPSMLAAAPGGGAAGASNSGPPDYGRGATGQILQFPFNPAAVTTPLQRQLVPIPVLDASGGLGSNSVAGGGAVPGGGGEIGKRRYELEDTVAIAEGPTKRKIPINSRLGPRLGPIMQQNCSLELRKVPRGLNTIAHLNNHFAKFGKIVNIQVSYDGDPEAAIVTFSTHAEANVAYRSTEAVLNNRFIKVFWHSQDINTMNSDTQIIGMGGGGGRKNASQYHLHNVPAVPTPTSDSAKTTNTSQATTNAPSDAANSTTLTQTTTTSAGGETAAATLQPASMRLKNNVAPRAPTPAANAAIIRKKQEEQAKAVVQLANGLRKRKQELMQGYVKQMKSALELVERCEPQDPQRGKTLSTIKVLQETIDKLRKEIAAEQEQIQQQINQQPPAKKTKEQQKKELLDIELELFAQQQEGNDTSAIQKRLEELQRSLGIAPSGGAHAAVNSNNGINSHTGLNAKMSHYNQGQHDRRVKSRTTFPEGSTRVDRRPKTIVVTGFTGEEADFVLGHFKHFGEITKHDVDREIPQLILSYSTRNNAEQAVLRGKLFKDKRLQITWAPVILPTQTIEPSSADKAIATESNKAIIDHKLALNIKTASDQLEINSDTLPELRLEDEEEDDESEDRSWRR